MPSTIVKASELLAAIADRPAPGDVLEVEPGTVALGPRTVTWSGDFEVKPRTMPPDVLGPQVHGGANMPVTLAGSLALKGGVFVRGFNLDSAVLGNWYPGTLLLSGACDVEDVRVTSRHIAVTTGQFDDRAKAVKIKRMRIEGVGAGATYSEQKYKQGLYGKAIDRGGLDVEDLLVYGGVAYGIHWYPNALGGVVRRAYVWDNGWGLIYSGENGNASTGGSGTSNDNGVYASIVGGLRQNNSGVVRKAITSWWGNGAAPGKGNVFGQGAYSGGADGIGYAIVESIQAAPKRMNPNVPGDYRQAPDSPTRHLGPMSLRPGGTNPPPAPPPSTDPCAAVKVERDAARAEVIDLRTSRDAAVMARLSAEASRDDAIARGLEAANRVEELLADLATRTGERDLARAALQHANDDIDAIVKDLRAIRGSAGSTAGDLAKRLAAIKGRATTALGRLED